MLLCCDPPMKGREPTGVSITAAIHQPAETTIEASAISRSTTRRPSLGGAATRYARPSGGTTSSTCSCFVRNPKPMSAPVATIHLRRPSSIARNVVYAASVMRSTSSASGLLNLNMSAATGVVAITAPAIRPAAAESLRRTAAYTTATVATPISAWGTRMLQELRPNARTDRPMIQSDAGGLSTVIELAASNDPKNHAFQLCDPACAAAE